MILGRTQYRYVTTGEGFLFLHIPLNNPQTVYYHLAEPTINVNTQIWSYPMTQKFHHCTTVSQVVAFCLLALPQAQCLQRWHQEVVDALDIWNVDYSIVLCAIPKSNRKETPTSDYIPQTYHLKERSPIKLHPRRSQVSYSSICHSKVRNDKDPLDASNNKPECRSINTPSQPPNCAIPTRGSTSQSRSKSGSSHPAGSS